MFVENGPPGARLITVFGTVVYVDSTGALRHGSVESSPSNAKLVSVSNDPLLTDQCRLVHEREGIRHTITCSFERCHVDTSGDPSDTRATFQLTPLERGLIALKSENRFLSAHPDGSVHLSADVCSTWELFLASENWCSGDRSHRPVRASDSPELDIGRIQSYVVHPTIRTRAATRPPKAKILAYGYPGWSHGRVYYDLCKHLHRHGYVVDILNWQENHASYFNDLRSYYDLFITALDGVRTLVDSYQVPYEKIIAVSHHEFDIRMLIEQKGIDVFDRFANYAVVSEFLYCASLMKGVGRAPMVASLGIDYDNFHSPPSERLSTVGYASSMSVTTYGVEWKRGALAEAAATAAGLAFSVAGSTGEQTSFHDMPRFYRSVDAVVTSSISEAAQLPVMEAAAAGRLVICTPVGHFPQKAYQGAGIMAPVEASKFVSFTAETLRYYADNPAAYAEKCHAIQKAAELSDWKYHIQDWLDVVEQAGRS